MITAIVWIGSMVIAGYAAHEKGRNAWLWAMFALFFGPLATIVALCVPKTEDEKMKDLVKLKAKMKAMDLDK